MLPATESRAWHAPPPRGSDSPPGATAHELMGSTLRTAVLRQELQRQDGRFTVEQHLLQERAYQLRARHSPPPPPEEPAKTTPDRPQAIACRKRSPGQRKLPTAPVWRGTPAAGGVRSLAEELAVTRESREQWQRLGILRGRHHRHQPCTLGDKANTDITTATMIEELRRQSSAVPGSIGRSRGGGGGGGSDVTPGLLPATLDPTQLEAAAAQIRQRAEEREAAQVSQAGRRPGMRAAGGGQPMGSNQVSSHAAATNAAVPVQPFDVTGPRGGTCSRAGHDATADTPTTTRPPPHDHHDGARGQWMDSAGSLVAVWSSSSAPSCPLSSTHLPCAPRRPPRPSHAHATEPTAARAQWRCDTAPPYGRPCSTAPSRAVLAQAAATARICGSRPRRRRGPRAPPRGLAGRVPSG
jgi:hypothetical protein